MIAAAMTHGDVIIENVLAEHQKPLLAKLREAGVLIEEDIDRIHVACPGELKGIHVKTLPYPGFPTDMQAQIMAMMTICQGRSTVMETVFENRFMHVVELNRMGANIATTGARGAIIEGPAKLTGCEVNASDLRAGAAMILAGLVAEGQTTIGNLHHIDRGYEDIVGKLQALGADIQRISVKD
jgi:UDP-N-acetylglucosamine 1-carboxyvinyltransferase